MNRVAALTVVCSAGLAAAYGLAAQDQAPLPASTTRQRMEQKAGGPFEFDPALFEKKRKPGPHDWLANFSEPGQTFEQFLAGKPTGVTSHRRVIVLQPLGHFERDELAVLESLRQFTSAYFQLPVRIQRPLPLPEHGARQRRMGMLGRIQHHTLTIMDEVLLPHLPDDAVCYLGITMADLYPEPSWNFVFGQASFDKRVGVYSLIRYTNRFWGEPETEHSKEMFLRRSFKVLAHETGHMFSIAHCTANECLMNGTNSLDETDRSTIHLCPVCLRKLQWSSKFDVVQRYRQIRRLYADAGFADWSEWLDRRLARLGAAPAGQP
jgi:archaemetzincin